MIRTFRVQGCDHQDNEDALFETIIGLNEGHLHICAVMDGCSSGIDSVFASHLIKKCLQETIGSIPIEAFNSLTISRNLSDLSLLILEKVYKRISIIGNLLNLKISELESTIVLLVASTFGDYSIIFVGDGFCSIDGEIYENSQNNTPHYLAHYLNKNVKSLFEDIIQYVGVFEQEIAIATDGVDSFYDYENSERIDLKHFFLVDNFLAHKESCFYNKMVGIKTGRHPEYKNKKYIKNRDDISLIKIILDDNVF